jgi:hypothetical protein
MRGIYILLFFIFFACKKDVNRTVGRAFYHWEQDLSLSQYEYERINRLNVKRLYVRFFDVDWQSGRPQPLSIINIQDTLPEAYDIVPVVFITNRTLLNSDEADVSRLAERLLKKLDKLTEDLSQNIPEIQIDCDWSGQSRALYFKLLGHLRPWLNKQGIKLSATIRLHQVKYYQRTGVPGVDRGVLMFYNTGTIDDPSTKNSILDLSIARAYFKNFDEYPLPLDIALPIFRWGVIFQEDRFVQIINGLDDYKLTDTTRFVKVGENQFELRKSMYLEGYYLYKGDRIRTEKVDKESLLQAAKLLATELRADDRYLIFYHLDSTLIADYPHEVLETIYHTFD